MRLSIENCRLPKYPHHATVAIDLDGLASLNNLRCSAYIDYGWDSILPCDDAAVGKKTALIRNHCYCR